MRRVARDAVDAVGDRVYTNNWLERVQQNFARMLAERRARGGIATRPPIFAASPLFDRMLSTAELAELQGATNFLPAQAHDALRCIGCNHPPEAHETPPPERQHEPIGRCLWQGCTCAAYETAGWFMDEARGEDYSVVVRRGDEQIRLAGPGAAETAEAIADALNAAPDADSVAVALPGGRITISRGEAQAVVDASMTAGEARRVADALQTAADVLDGQTPCAAPGCERPRMHHPTGGRCEHCANHCRHQGGERE